MFLLTDNLNFTDDKFGKTKIHSQLEVFDFNHSGYLYSAYSSPLLLRGSPAYNIDTASALTRYREYVFVCHWLAHYLLKCSSLSTLRGTSIKQRSCSGM